MLNLFTDLVGQGKTVVLVTHERDIRRHVSRQITLVDGCIADDARSEAHHRASGEVQQ
ncbi:hypothetical protein [Reticulibacter mediterranei]|uniref:hypothetical protein n=1 Tax=Reticulibacter mediterranei TaxID=2778369 RepID=UPI001F2756CA|nr:hypothetical protein [Reticulibacter mediterranei]